jgi:hypothetical protein
MVNDRSKRMAIESALGIGIGAEAESPDDKNKDDAGRLRSMSRGRE